MTQAANEIVEMFLDNEELRQALWRRIQAILTEVGITSISYDTLESMLWFGDDAREMADRLELSVDTAMTRRSANGKKVLASLYQRRPSLFLNVMEVHDVVIGA